jgi:predicted nucleotidyltransferase
VLTQDILFRATKSEAKLENIMNIENEMSNVMVSEVELLELENFCLNQLESYNYESAEIADIMQFNDLSIEQ